MTQYNVHLYREMRLTFAGIEAETPEAAALLAREKPTADADDLNDCEGENLAALVDVAGADDFSDSVTIDFDDERPRRNASRLLSALQLAQLALNTAPRFAVGDTDSYKIASQVDRAIEAAMSEGISPGGVQPYSVLLLYPDYANDSGLETYYAFVKASSSLEAVAQAQRQAVAAQDGVVFPPDDFAPLLVTEGHHAALPASCREGEA